MGVQVVPAKRLIKSVSAKARSGGSLLSQERMRTVSRGISLRALGSKPEAAVEELVQGGGHGLKDEQLSALQKLLPDSMERQAIASFRMGQHPRHQGKTDLDRLGKEDKVAVLLISIPDVDEMLETLQFQRQYPDLLKEVEEQLVLIQQACEGVVSSRQLKLLLHCLLDGGNYLNEGTLRAGALGFELASVATAAGTKDKNHTSLLCHALREVARVCPDISHLPTQLLPVTKAADLKMGSIDNRMGELKSGLSKWGRQAGKKPAHSSDEQETKVAHQRASHSFAQLEVLRGAAMGSLQGLAKHMATAFKSQNPTEVLGFVHDMLVEVAAALPKM
ncbi:hypothetical protein ABBQ38_003038 [Trebouxia sp. C0009 RCD-2024]